MYDLDLFDGWSAKDIDDANGTPILNISVDASKKPGGITAAFAQGLEKATAYTVQEFKSCGGVHFTPPNGKTTTRFEYARRRSRRQGFAAVKADIIPLPTLTPNDNPKGSASDRYSGRRP